MFLYALLSNIDSKHTRTSQLFLAYLLLRTKVSCFVHKYSFYSSIPRCVLMKMQTSAVLFIAVLISSDGSCFVHFPKYSLIKRIIVINSGHSYFNCWKWKKSWGSHSLYSLQQTQECRLDNSEWRVPIHSLESKTKTQFLESQSGWKFVTHLYFNLQVLINPGIIGLDITSGMSAYIPIC